MTKIFIPQADRKIIGGGWTFNRNFITGIKRLNIKRMSNDFEIVADIKDCDVILITGATMVDTADLEQAKKDGKKIILRVDNIPRESRNRGCGFSRLKKSAGLADKIVYQSKWAKEYAGYYLGDGEVIYNGVDTEIFKKNGEKLDTNGKDIYLFDAHSSNENKRFEEARYIFNKIWRHDKNAEFWILGNKWAPSEQAKEMRKYNYDFFDGEVVNEIDVIENQLELAKILRSAIALIYPAFADACPNIVLEAMACGCKITGVNMIGGTGELAGVDFSLERMINQYLQIIENPLTLKL